MAIGGSSVVRYEDHDGTLESLSAARRRLFDWLESRTLPAPVREDLLDIVTAVVVELMHARTPFALEAEDIGHAVVVRFTSEVDPAGLGRAAAAVDRLAPRLFVHVMTTVGDGYLAVDVSLSRFRARAFA